MGPTASRAEIEAAVRSTVKRIGYEQSGFHWNRSDFENNLHGQSAEIAMGVDESGNKDEGAGDQGIMFGYATDETPGLMPATLYYSHKILERMAADRHSGAAPFLEPDAKSQVTLHTRTRSRSARPRWSSRRSTRRAIARRATTPIRPSTPSCATMSRGVMHDVLPDGFVTDETAIYINPTGAFEIGGPDGDAGRDRAQDHRRHLWRRGAARRRRVQRQGPDQGRSLGRLCRALSREERRRGRPRPPLHDPAELRDRHRRAAVASMSTRTAPAPSRRPSSRRCCRSSSA